MAYDKFLMSVLATLSLSVPSFAQSRNTALSITQSGISSPAQSRIPHLVASGKSVQLRVDGKPFIVLGGELGNSSASDMHYMQPFWNGFTALHLNTILSPVYWDLLEPSEGRFDFRLVDSMIHTAHRFRLKVVLLWFGSWKNSMSGYAPQWIKTDPLRFPRARNNAGKSMEILSAFSNNNLEADCHAFAALMKHLRGEDRDHTVIMVQVENEIGMLQAARERTVAADSAFDRSVPPELINYLTEKKDSLVPELSAHWGKTNFITAGSWATVFGSSLTTDEIFQAWFYARYANRVAAAGKKEYDLPMYVNAALNHRNLLPGEYPSAGPLPQVMDIWQAAAPAIDFLAPDFYNPRFAEYGDLYTRRNNPLFIPEIGSDASNAARVFYALGHYHGLGFSPFSIESIRKPEEDPVGKSYHIIGQLIPEISRHEDNSMDGVLIDSAHQRQEITFGDYVLTVAHDYTLGWSPEAKKANWPQTGALIIEERPGEFIIAGTGVVITFRVATKPDRSAGILWAEEGAYKDGKWLPGRRMNGDQDHQGRHIRVAVGDWSIQRVKLYQY